MSGSRFVEMIEGLESRQLLAGNGLAATYFNNADLTGASVTRVDATVNFNWKTGSPDSRIGADTFSARWTGTIAAKYSQAYTFSTVSDDGVRLWVDGKLIINQWNNHAAREDKGVITLAAGKSYSIKMEYYENYGGATAQLFWASASQARQIVPQAQLSSSATAVTPPSSTPPPPVTTPGKTGSLRVSDNGRYLVQANGTPFFYLADTAWTAPVKLNRADVDYYLGTRAAQGFNVVQIVATDEHYWAKNYAGQTPLINNNPATPNDAFFSHVDYIVSKAASLGMYVALMPTWGRNVADPSWKIFNTSNAYAYGKYLGARYRNASNIIWLSGGDWAVNDSGTADIWRSLVKGLGDGDGNTHLTTFHPRGDQASRTYWPNDGWLDFDMIQSGHKRDSASYNLVAAEYGRGPVKPVIEGEANYEGIPVNAVYGSLSGPRFDDYDVRKKAYWDIFAGAAGTAYGSNDVFQFYNGSYGDMAANTPWRQAVFAAGAQDMQWLKNLMLSRAYLSRIPDQSVVVSGTLSGTDHIQATRDVGGSFAMVYSASGKGFTVNMSKITGGSVKASWYDPRTGQSTAIGTYANTGNRAFTPPSNGYGKDWVLILDRG